MSRLMLKCKAEKFAKTPNENHMEKVIWHKTFFQKLPQIMKKISADNMTILQQKAYVGIKLDS